MKGVHGELSNMKMWSLFGPHYSVVQSLISRAPNRDDHFDLSPDEFGCFETVLLG